MTDGQLKAMQAQVLLDYYMNAFRLKYGEPAAINNNKHFWAFGNMAHDLGIKNGKKTIDYYMGTQHFRHPPNKLLDRYEILNAKRLEYEKDEEDRKEIRKTTESRVSEWQV